MPAVQALLDNGADTSARDNTGNPPLHYAAGCACSGEGRCCGMRQLAVRHALGLGGEGRVFSNSSCPVGFSLPRCWLPTCLVVPIHPAESTLPPFCCLHSYGREECVRLLLAAGADVAAKNDKGQTAAEVRASRGW